MNALRTLSLHLLLGCALALPAPAQQWIHHSFSDDAIARMLSAPIEAPRATVDPLLADALERAHLEVSQAVSASVRELESTYTLAKARVLPAPCLWPDTHWRLFNPGLDQWGIKGIPCPASPISFARP